MAQYTKAAEDATNKQKMYDQAKGLLADDKRVTDLELIFSWVKSNVQGAGRLTNTEIQQAAQAGSYSTRIKNAFAVASTGRLAAPLEQQFLSDIKRAADTAAKAAASLKAQIGPQSSQSPQVPTGGDDALQFDPKTGTVH